MLQVPKTATRRLHKGGIPLKPECPYNPKSLRGALFLEDWSDLTVMQIAEVMNKDVKTVYQAIRDIRERTGYQVPHLNRVCGVGQCK